MRDPVVTRDRIGRRDGRQAVRQSVIKQEVIQIS